MRILLAEDDASQAESIKHWLELDGYSVDWVEQGDHALLAMQQHDYDCILLDRGLPKLSGDQVIASLRMQQPNQAVIFITARDSIDDRVEGLDLGANDYLVKPFSLEELSARVRSQLRQKQSHATQQIRFANIVLDYPAKQVFLDDQVVNLTGKELQILYKLMQKPEHIISREQLENSLYAWDEEIESNAIEVFIYQLRKKLGAKSIKTIRGLGYKMSKS